MCWPIYFIYRQKMATQVVTVGQPTEGMKGAELQMMAPPPGMGTTVVLPQGLPPGLAYLGALNEVLIHQHFDVLEGKYKPPDRHAKLKIYFHISQPKHILWVLKRTVLLLTLMDRKIILILRTKKFLIWTYAWVKVFRIIPEFRILRLTFHRKSASKCRIREDIMTSVISFQSF